MWCVNRRRQRHDGQKQRLHDIPAPLAYRAGRCAVDRTVVAGVIPGHAACQSAYERRRHFTGRCVCDSSALVENSPPKVARLAKTRHRKSCESKSRHRKSLDSTSRDALLSTAVLAVVSESAIAADGSGVPVARGEGPGQLDMTTTSSHIAAKRPHIGNGICATRARMPDVPASLGPGIDRSQAESPHHAGGSPSYSGFGAMYHNCDGRSTSARRSVRERPSGPRAPPGYEPCPASGRAGRWYTAADENP